jgi:Fe-S-cluster containining protein
VKGVKTYDPGEFKCERCGHCCRGKSGVTLNIFDVSLLADNFKMGLNQFLGKYCSVSFYDFGSEEDRYQFHLIYSGDGCPFLDGNCCIVNDVKPDMCKNYPFGFLTLPYAWPINQAFKLCNDMCPAYEKLALKDDVRITYKLNAIAEQWLKTYYTHLFISNYYLSGEGDEAILNEHLQQCMGQINDPESISNLCVHIQEAMKSGSPKIHFNPKKVRSCK